MKKTWSILAALTMTLTLAACSTHTSTPAKSSATSSKTASKAQSNAKSSTSSQSASSSSASSSSASSTQKTPWTSAKATQLASFMAHFSQTMDQQYQSYTPSHGVSFYGLTVPGTLTEMPPAMGDAKLDIAWSTTGVGTAAYQLVACYSDAATAKYADCHLYFFVIHNGQPEVLVTMQNQGNENNWLYFDQTQNQALKAGFATIVNG